MSFGLRISRRVLPIALCVGLSLSPAEAQLPPGVASHSVRLQIDQGALQAIPPEERGDVTVGTDRSASARALIATTPSGKAVPVILIVIGVLSIPVIWDTLHEMLRREYYGGCIIDGRQSPTAISCSKIVPANMVMFIRPDGRSEVYESHSFTEELLERLLKAL